MAKNDQKKILAENFWDPFFDFSFPSYGRFREGTPHFVILSFCGVGGVPSRKRP